MVNHSTPTPRKNLVTWILVADGRSAKVYTRKPVTRTVPGQKPAHATESHIRVLTLVSGMVWKAEPVTEYEMGRNATGMVFESASSARHMAEPHIDAREEIKDNLARAIAKKLNRKKAEKAFDRLVVIAPAKTLGELRKHFDEQTLKSVEAEIPKDLTHFDTPALATHLEGTA